MAFCTIPKDMDRIKNKVVLNMTKRQLICFGTAILIGVPTYIFTRGTIGNSFAVLLMMAVMSPLFLLAMYEKDGISAEKLLRNYIRAKFYWSDVRAYKAESLYKTLTKQEGIILAETTAQSNKGAKQAAKPKYPSGKGKPGRKPKRR